MKAFKQLVLLSFLALSVLPATAQKTSGTHIYLIVNKYIQLKNYLADNDEVRAGFAGSELFAILGATPDKGLTQKQKKLLAPHMDNMMEDAREISYAGENAVNQRKYFLDLTQHLLAVLKNIPLHPATLYVQYCPRGNGYWLSETTKGKNPYNSNELNNCSKTRETLPGNGRSKKI